MRQLFSSIPGQVLDFIVVLIGAVVIFRTQLQKLVTDLMTTVTSKAKAIE